MERTLAMKQLFAFYFSRRLRMPAGFNGSMSDGKIIRGKCFKYIKNDIY